MRPVCSNPICSSARYCDACYKKACNGGVRLTCECQRCSGDERGGQECAKEQYTYQVGEGYIRDNTKYNVRAKCINCYHKNIIIVTKGTLAQKVIAKCPHCECNTLYPSDV